MSVDVKITPASAIVLGLLDLIGGGTPYDLKMAVARTVGNFWTFQHAQLYTETDRLAKAGLLREEREEHGRRRKHYTVTAKGRQALEEWRDEPTGEVPELRDLGLLKLYMGADPKALGTVQAEAHEAKLQDYLELRRFDRGGEPRGPWIALESGIQYEKLMVRFWKRLADSGA